MRKKPEFKRQEYFRYKRLGKSWRKPRGKHSKMRTYLGGKMISPAIGYGTKAEERGLHPSGYEEVLITTPSQLEKLNKEMQVVRISGKVGDKKAKLITKTAEKLGIKVLNPRRESK